MPDDLADQKEWADYYRKVSDRDRKVFEKKMESQVSDLKQKQEESEKEWQSRLEDEKSRIKAEEDARRNKEVATRQFDNVVASADKFIGRRKEFDFGDGKTVRQKNDEWQAFSGTIDYIKQQNPQFASRDLVGDFFNNVPDAVNIVQQYGVSAPEGAKKFALLIELENVARQHNLYSNRQYDSNGSAITGSGEPDFDAAYAIKKQRDGADIDELNQASARGAEQALNVVSARNASQVNAPKLSAQETVPREDTQASQESILQRMQQLQTKMSTMTPEQAQQARLELEKIAGEAGLVLQQS